MMPFFHRKIASGTSNQYDSCKVCYFCPYDCTGYSPPPPPASHHQFSTVLVLILCGLGVIFLLFSYLVFVRFLRSSGRMNHSPVEVLVGNDGGNLNETDQYHVWCIRTVGLPQSLIDSIPIFDYKRGEKMIEGTSDHCPVCLSEFQENESLRLLPKCSHAFHLLCIDTWLRSHKNCPVCRSPVSIDITNASSVANSMNAVSDHSGPEFQTNGTAEDTSTPVHESGGESRFGSDEMGRSLSRKRVLSDLSDRRVLEVDRELETVRRSVSMDHYSVLIDNKLDEGCS